MPALPDPPQAAAAHVKMLAAEAGFALAGIAALDSEPVGVRLADWLANGYAGTMEYLGRHTELRRDPAGLLPGVRSLIALGVPYKTHDPVAELPAGSGRVSNYAWGDDYHLVIRERLARLCAALSASFPGIQTRGCVDTAPILEREWAARAGLGWIGKHTLLIDRRYGSYVFLAEILTDLELAPDPPATAHCGTCTACLDACPTAAFPEPGVLDASKCISYLTIEHRGDIEPALAALMSDWLYGCDICQAVCPWNRKSPATLEPAFQPRPQWKAPSLEQVATVDEPTYADWTRRSAMKRAKRSGLQRNARLLLEQRRNDPESL